MNIRSIASNDNNTLEICIEGAFGFNLLNEFRDAYKKNTNEENKNHYTNYIVNLFSTRSIDTSALGMLLNMKRELDKNDRDIRIIHCSPKVLKILIICRFDIKFTIE